VAETIKLPVIGPTKPAYVYGTAAVVAAFVAYRYWSASQGTGSDEPVAGDEEVIGDQYAVGTYSPPVTQDATIGDGADDGTTVGANPTTDAEWVQYVVELLDAYGVDAVALTLALGRYLDRKALTPAQVDMVTQARALAGNPPQSGALPIIPQQGGTPKPPTPPTKPTTPPPVPRPAPGKKYVTVKRGDTLSEIAARNKVTIGKIKSFPENGYLFKKTGTRRRDSSGTWIYAGDRIRVK
jgi:hypothetical protein